jgi:hypothetical protein
VSTLAGRTTSEGTQLGDELRLGSLWLRSSIFGCTRRVVEAHSAVGHLAVTSSVTGNATSTGCSGPLTRQRRAALWSR